METSLRRKLGSKLGLARKCVRLGPRAHQLRVRLRLRPKTAKKPKKGEKVIGRLGVKHYFKNGTEHKGATHKDAKGKVMSGKTHTASSKYLFHKKDLPTSATKKA
jgi:hypothetical protein